MKNLIIELIEDNISNVKLINGLHKLGIDASIYYFNSPSIVFKLIGIENLDNSDELLEKYFEWLKNGESIDFSESRGELKKYAEMIYENLKYFSSEN